MTSQDERLYAVGDIHGQFDLLQEVIDQITAHGGPSARIVFMGDYTDRGPHSREVVEYLSLKRAENPHWICLKGNHDRAFEYYLRTPSQDDPRRPPVLPWLHERIGGLTTLASYGICDPAALEPQDLHAKAKAAVPAHHVAFLRSLPSSYAQGPYFFAHAGIHPARGLADQIEDDLIWIREEFHNHTAPYEKLIIHGHTPVKRPTHYGNRINIDTGAAYGGPLTALCLWPDGQAEVITPNGPLDHAP